MAIKEYAGGAASTTLSSSITAGSTSLSCADLTNWPTGATGNFWVKVDGGLASEEKIRCSSRAGNNLTVATGGRGGDGTTATSHSSGAIVEHVFTAEDAREANDHVFNVGIDQHSQYLNLARHDVAARHTIGTVIPAAVVGTDLASTAAGVDNAVAHGTHTHGFPTLTLYTPTWSGGGAIGNGTLTGRYAKVGKMCYIQIDWVAGSSTTYGTSNWAFSLPAGVTASLVSYIPVFAFPVGAGFLAGLGQVSGGSINAFLPDTSPVTPAMSTVNASYPIVWVNGSSLTINGLFPCD